MNTILSLFQSRLFETSSKNGENIHELFHQVCLDYLDNKMNHLESLDEIVQVGLWYNNAKSSSGFAFHKKDLLFIIIWNQSVCVKARVDCCSFPTSLAFYDRVQIIFIIARGVVGGWILLLSSNTTLAPSLIFFVGLRFCPWDGGGFKLCWCRQEVISLTVKSFFRDIFKSFHDSHWYGFFDL